MTTSLALLTPEATLGHMAESMTGTLAMLFGEAAPGALAHVPHELPSTSDVSVTVGFVGGLQGQLVIGMAEPVALAMAGTLLMSPLLAFDELAQSAMAEVGNMLAGGCATALAEAGVPLDITVPTVIAGSQVKVRLPQLTIHEMAVQLPFGELRLAIGLKGA